MTSGTLTRYVAISLVAFATLALPSDGDAQFGRLKQLENKVRPDSAALAENAAKDSIAVANGEVVDSTAPAKSRLSRAMGAAKKASDKFEDVTGVSTKDAALAASGMGIGAIAAKKLGVDPTNIASKAIAQANQQRAAGAKLKSTAGAAAGMGDLAKLTGMIDPAKLQAATKGKGATAAALPAGLGLPGFGEAEAQAMIAFQQEMMQVAMAASGGDAAAQARLEAWNDIALKHQPEIEKLALTGQAGDMAAIQKMYRLQLDMMREWSRSSAVKKATRAAGGKAKP